MNDGASRYGTPVHFFSALVDSGFFFFQAKEYLRLMDQFQELGFDKASVKVALVTSHFDEEKTLDILTGT